jgi:hypothetical protein
VVGGARWCGSVAALSLLSLARLSPHLTRHSRMACPAYSLSLFLSFSLLSFAVATAYSRAPVSLAHSLAPLCLDTHTPPTLVYLLLLRHSLPLSSSHSQLLTHFGVNVWTVVAPFQSTIAGTIHYLHTVCTRKTARPMMRLWVLWVLRTWV